MKHPAAFLFTVALPVVAGCVAIVIVVCIGLRLSYDLLIGPGVAAVLGADSLLYGLIKVAVVAACLTGVVFLVGQVSTSLATPIMQLDKSIAEKPALTWAVVIGGLATIFGDSLAGIIDKDQEMLKGFFKFGTGIVFAGAGYFFGKPSWMFKSLGVFLWLGVPIALYAVAVLTVRRTNESPGQTIVLILFTTSWLAVALVVAVLTYMHRPRGTSQS